MSDNQLVSRFYTIQDELIKCLHSKHWYFNYFWEYECRK